LGKLDQAWGRHWPLNRLGFTKVIFAQKV